MEEKVKRIIGKKLEQWVKEYPILEQLIATKEVFWVNPKYCPYPNWSEIRLSEENIQDAEQRLQRFAPYIATVFPETKRTSGIIESPFIPISKMQNYLKTLYRVEIPGQLWLKCDSHLPISGSIKARGGIYEVLKHAEDLALSNGRLSLGDDYSVLANEEFRQFFSGYSIAVGSTGNLGMSIGIIGSKLGFKVTVHMSADAKEWKKRLLRNHGVEVIEYKSDYSKAVEEGRKQAETDSNCYFIDDENSPHLFLGYAVAAYRLQQQLEQQNIVVDEKHPLFVYLPCGVGGAPGGVTFGLKSIFGPHVHCFFVEPTHSPCMLLGLVTGMHDRVSVQDFGIDNITDADGLAVGRPSRFVGKLVEPLLSGSFTVSDEELYLLLSALADLEGIYLEPSALAGVSGAARLMSSEMGLSYLREQRLEDKMVNATHIAWATGGSMVPKDVMDTYYMKGVALRKLSGISEKKRKHGRK
ncbi:D-serine ammonia-lyase [Thermoflavimicrobium dichotomicum]|uniref:Probable D-serine dehydratase n=1 Tax=Thermoflavimicrobium dichotomicum TaxID=46223 RepID=A0A1I3NZL7_9BACL|nr:D-serine ammonia-lyase [Thermoflavimicrobium dichotomicum]SFJ14651.1 D-serine ammonia-lyase [Thermoflavimicrobium dichotomicum]